MSGVGRGASGRRPNSGLLRGWRWRQQRPGYFRDRRWWNIQRLWCGKGKGRNMSGADRASVVGVKWGRAWEPRLTVRCVRRRLGAAMTKDEEIGGERRVDRRRCVHQAVVPNDKGGMHQH